MDIYGGQYNARLVVNGSAALDGVAHLSAGENTVELTERFRLGHGGRRRRMPRLADGSPARDPQNKWLGNNVIVMVFDERGEMAYSRPGYGGNETSVPVANIPPPCLQADTRRCMVTLEQSEMGLEREAARRQLRRSKRSLKIKPGETIHPVLPDRTVELRR